MYAEYWHRITGRKEIRYLFAGGASAGANLLLLYVLTDIFSVWYLFSSVVSYTFGFFVSFTLHKFWTFKSMELRRARRELPLHMLLAGANLWLNTFLLYFFVEYFGLWYMLGQALATGLIALEGYFLSKRIFG